MTTTTTGAWETVYTVEDYYDGPCRGVADYQGAPHAYLCTWDMTADNQGTIFLLSPITPEQFAVVQEDWAIWQRWLKKSIEGALQADDKHPALAADWLRHTQLQPIMRLIFQIDEAHAVRAVPEFRGTLQPEHEFEVRWQPA